MTSINNVWATWGWAVLSSGLGWILESSQGDTHHGLPTAFVFFKRAVTAIEEAACRDTGERLFKGKRAILIINSWAVYNEKRAPGGGRCKVILSWRRGRFAGWHGLEFKPQSLSLSKTLNPNLLHVTRMRSAWQQPPIDVWMWGFVKRFEHQAVSKK